MIICLSCGSELSSNFKCNNCGVKFEILDSIVVFCPDVDTKYEDYSAEGLDYLYKFENKHFWFLHRKRVINNVFKLFVVSDAHIMEIGAGTGNITRMLMSLGYSNLSVGELHMNGLIYAKKYGITNLYQFNILDSPFKLNFDVIGLFDVLEHIDNHHLALQNIHKMLNYAGLIILTVPCHNFLWSNIDVNSGHKRRYSHNEIEKALLFNGFKIIYKRSFFISILPILFFRKLFNRKEKKINRVDLVAKSGLRINAMANFFLKHLSNIDFILSPLRLKIGGSIIVVAEKI